jgi:hypothetical protein
LALVPTRNPPLLEIRDNAIELFGILTPTVDPPRVTSGGKPTLRRTRVNGPGQNLLINPSAASFNSTNPRSLSGLSMSIGTGFALSPLILKILSTASGLKGSQPRP